MVNTKQVIVVRKDLNMRKGKMIAQGSHASMAFLTSKMMSRYDNELCSDGWYEFETVDCMFSKDEKDQIEHWLRNSFRKICVYVNSEEELLSVYNAAKEKDLLAKLIEDNGATEFGGVKTLTCCAIGPHWDNLFEGITNHLPLL
jgi:PTH2 family peptidyl-tRNA hydrolase